MFCVGAADLTALRRAPIASADGAVGRRTAGGER